MERQGDHDTLVDMKREAANRILHQLEKRRAHAEKVFVENEKRSKVALEKMRKEAKQEEKHEEVVRGVAACCCVLPCLLALPAAGKRADAAARLCQ